MYAYDAAKAGVRIRSKEYAKSWEVSGVPSDHLALARR